MNTLMQKTKENSPNRFKKLEETRQQRDQNLRDMLDKLYGKILEQDYKQMMISASEQGYDSTVIYRFGYADEFEGYRLSFLLRGPMSDRRNEGMGLEFFYNKDITPVMDRLKTEFKPMNLFLKYDRNKKENLIIVSWKEQKST